MSVMLRTLSRDDVYAVYEGLPNATAEKPLRMVNLTAYSRVGDFENMEAVRHFFTFYLRDEIVEEIQVEERAK